MHQIASQPKYLRKHLLSAALFQQIWNDRISKSCQFPENLKLPDITPVFKEDDKNLVKNYRPVNVLPTLPKVFEKIIEKQVVNPVNIFPHVCSHKTGSIPYMLFCDYQKNGKRPLITKVLRGSIDGYS